MAIGAPYPRGFDAHTHLDFPRLAADLEGVLARSRDAAVHGWVIAAADPAHWDRLVATARQAGAHAMLGVHPWWVADAPPMRELVARLDDPRVIGIGETGLDYFRARDPSERDIQLTSLREHLDLARQRDLPVALHCVRAHTALLDICARDGLPRAGGLIHAWSGAASQARRAVSLGLHVSFGPLALRSRRVQHALCEVPEGHLLLETDCPDWPLPGKEHGEPADLAAVATQLAPLLEISPESLLHRTGENARALFRVPSARVR